MIPQKLKDNAAMLSTALMGIACRNQFRIMQTVDESVDARIINKIEFIDKKEIVLLLRTWLITHKMTYNIIDFNYNDNDYELTMLTFDIDGDIWEVPLIVNMFTERSPYVKNFNQLDIWINTYVARRMK